jgi:hypothetical protein
MTPPPAPVRARRRIDLLDRALEHRLTKLLLAGLVIVSLLPLDPSFERALRPLFLLVFGAELAARWLVWRNLRGGESFTRALFAISDTLAFVSFLPLELVIADEQVQLLALIRLTRLLMLLRFAKELALDIYTIMTRREQLQQFALVTGAVLFLSFVSAVILAQLSIPHDETPDAHFGDQLWWSFRQMESADNLVPTLRNNPVLVVISLMLTVTGVFIISFIIGIGTTVVEQVVRSERRRPLAYHGHTIVTGAVHSSEVLIREFVRIYAKNRQIPSPEKLLTWLRHASPLQTAKSFPRVALLGNGDEPPPYLWEPLMRWVVYREGDAAEPESLERIAVADAKRAILLARDDLVHETDAVTVATLAAFRARNHAAQVFVEVTDSSTVPLVEQVGGPGTVALDMPRLLGMFLCQHLVTPGVERLYRDLLTADGSEIYTHVFVDEDEKAGLRAVASAGHMRFDDIAHLALVRHGVYLIGVLLGDEEITRADNGVVPFDDLVQWLNPRVLPDDDDRPARLGAKPGLVPLDKLRGLIAIAESYLPLAAVARDITVGTNLGDARAPSLKNGELDAILGATSVPPMGPQQVTLIGASDALPSLLRELSRYVHGVDATLFMSQRGDEVTPLGRRLESLGVGIDARDPLPGATGRTVELERGGRLTIFTHEGPDLAGFAARVLATRPPLEAAVFLCEPEGEERDARTGMRILRFVKLLEEGKVPHAGSLHMLAEYISVEKGSHIQRHVDARKCGFHSEQDLKLTLVATGTIKNYFMVHSAFVPGVTRVYDHLLEERGQEVVRLRFEAPPGLAETNMLAIEKALAPLGAIAFAVELRDRAVILAPDPSIPLKPADIVGIYVVADQPHLEAARKRRSSP